MADDRCARAVELYTSSVAWRAVADAPARNTLRATVAPLLALPFHAVDIDDGGNAAGAQHRQPEAVGDVYHQRDFRSHPNGRVDCRGESVGDGAERFSVESSGGDRLHAAVALGIVLVDVRRPPVDDDAPAVVDQVGSELPDELFEPTVVTGYPRVPMMQTVLPTQHARFDGHRSSTPRPGMNVCSRSHLRLTRERSTDGGHLRSVTATRIPVNAVAVPAVGVLSGRTPVSGRDAIGGTDRRARGSRRAGPPKWGMPRTGRGEDGVRFRCSVHPPADRSVFASMRCGLVQARPRRSDRDFLSRRVPPPWCRG